MNHCRQFLRFLQQCYVILNAGFVVYILLEVSSVVANSRVETGDFTFIGSELIYQT